MSLSAISRRYRVAVKCRTCFKAGFALDGQVKLAQPRWIGPDYFESKPKILVVLINPGDVSNGDEFEALISEYGKGNASLPQVLRYLEADMPKWKGARYSEFFFELMKLSPNSTAFVNVALCGAKNAKDENEYPQSMLSECFRRHSSKLMKSLLPDICLLSGQKTHQFRRQIAEFLPKTKLLTTCHYRPRNKDKKSQAKEIGKIRRAIKKWKSVKNG